MTWKKPLFSAASKARTSDALWWWLVLFYCHYLLLCVRILNPFPQSRLGSSVYSLHKTQKAQCSPGGHVVVRTSHVVVIQPCSFIHFDGLVFLMFWQQPWWEFSFYCNRLLKWRYWKRLFLRRWKQQNSSTGSTYVQHFIITPNSWKLPATQQAPFLSKLKFFHVLRFDWFQSFLGKFEQNIRCSPPKLHAATHMGKIVCKSNLRLEHEMQCLANMT